ncbi:MAG: NUDIX hydrolase [Bacillota bacterium]
MPENLFFVNVEAAIYRDDTWLMIIRGSGVSHAANTLSMPGGTVEVSDSNQNVLEEALRREVREEVGVEIDDLQYLESKHFVTDKGERVLDVVFLCQYDSGEATAASPEEVVDVAWMSIDEIRTHPKVPLWIIQSMEAAEKRRI